MYKEADIKIKIIDDCIVLECLGNWTNAYISHISLLLKKYMNTANLTKIYFDISKVHNFDSSGMILLIKYKNNFEKLNKIVTISKMSQKQKKLYNLIIDNNNYEKMVYKQSKVKNFFENIGKKFQNFIQEITLFMIFLGENITHLFFMLTHPTSIRYKEIIKYIEESALKALPIIAITAFLIGLVIAYQSAVQLEKFGANIFIIDMIGISVTRELAPLITAIVVAGRSGSSYTAQLGVMKLTEEIDAMKTMGFEPHRFLVIPRIIALILSLPLLIFFADIVGIFGGMVVAKLQLNISFTEFINRLQDSLEIKHYVVGIIKGPFFAWLIASIGCFRGFQVSRDTESIGYYTTVSVVNAIFLVIVCDALFSIILTELDI